MALRFFANTSSVPGSTTTNNYSRVPLGNFAVTTNQMTLAAFVNIADWNPTGNDIRVIVKQNIAAGSISQSITLRNAQTAATSTDGAASLIVPKPTGLTIGDLMIIGLYVTVNNVGAYGTIAYPTGFTEATTIQAYSGNYNKLFIAYKIATASDVSAANFTFTHTPSSGTTYRIAAVLAAYANVDPNSPIDVTPTTQRSADGVSSTNIVAPSITPSNDRPKRLLNFYGVSAGQLPTEGVNITAPAGQTEVGEIAGASTAYGRLLLADEAYASASATGTRTATTASAFGSFCASVLLRTNPAVNTSDDSYQWYLGLTRASTAGGPRTVAARFNYTNTTLQGTTPLEVGTYYHIAAVYDNGVGRVYVNGNLEGTATFNSGILSNDSHPVVIGNNAPDASNILAPNSPNGSITQPAIWSAALTASELQSLALGVTPYKIRAASLVSFVPQLGFNNIDVIRGTSLTPINADPVADPRMFVGSNKPTKLKKYPVFPETPTAPTLVVAPTSSSTITVSVSATPLSGTTIASYLVQRATTLTGFADEITGVNSNSYEDSSLTPSTTYYYRAKYTLNNGQISPWSITQQATTAATDGGGANPLAPIVTAVSSIV
jgi:hypothetical protein